MNVWAIERSEKNKNKWEIKEFCFSENMAIEAKQSYEDVKKFFEALKKGVSVFGLDYVEVYCNRRRKDKNKKFKYRIKKYRLVEEK